MKKTMLFAGALLSIVISSCGGGKNGGGTGINLFSVSQDKELGQQVSAEIAADPAKYPILDSARYANVYQYIYKVRDKILNSGNVSHKDDFAWRIQVIQDDNTINAFCTPGGYIYVYTGILRFLESEDQLAGVLGHEIAHADMRHSTRQMTTMYGVQTLIDVLAGDRESIKTITAGLIGLKFSRNHETEADERSVHYLCATDYNAAGGAGFFEKIQAAGGERTPEFLSTHPNPDNRIENYHNQKVTKGCTGTKTYTAEYQQMVKALPPKKN